MVSQRLFQQSARRLIAKPSSSIAPFRFMSPAGCLLQLRPATTSSTKAAPVSVNDSMEILVRQRLARPVAPHLTIYKPQLTWILSALNRVTGLLLSGPLYLFAIAYVASPLFGWQLGSAALAAGFAKWPVFAQVGAKMVAALPFTFHSFNCLRHLMWDMGRGIANQQVINSGWAAVGLTAVSTVALAILL